MRAALIGMVAFLCGALVVAVVSLAYPDWPTATREFFPVAPRKPAPPSYAEAIVINDMREGGVEHFLGPHISIRTQTPAQYKSRESVVLDLIVGKEGDVLSAKATSGDKVFFREAETRAHHVKFIPFRRNGKPIRARIKRFIVGIFPPESRPDYPVPFPEGTDVSSLRIKMKRAGHGGSYLSDLTISGDGRVTYRNDSGAIPGMHFDTITKDELAKLIEVLRSSRFFWLKSSYASAAFDQAWVSLEVSFAGRSIRVWDYEGREAGMPNAVKDVENAIERAARIDRWRYGNEETAPTLLKEKWDFKAKTAANAHMLHGVARLGGIVALRDLIALGAPLVTGPDGRSPLVAAATRGDKEIFSELLRQPVSWSSVVLGDALVAAADAGNEEFVLDLLWAKADPRFHDRIAGSHKTALMAAADVTSLPVTELLIRWVSKRMGEEYDPLTESEEIPKSKLAAFVNAKDPAGKTALHWAVEGRGNTAFDYGEPERDVARRAVIAALLKAGADVNARDSDGQTPLIANGVDADVARDLLAAGATVNARDKSGRTALMHCFAPELARALLEAGADIDAKDKEGRTAIDHATEVQQPDVVTFLQAWIAAHPRKTVPRTAAETEVGSK